MQLEELDGAVFCAATASCLTPRTSCYLGRGSEPGGDHISSGGRSRGFGVRQKTGPMLSGAGGRGSGGADHSCTGSHQNALRENHATSNGRSAMKVIKPTNRPIFKD
jgi:hypothetical protein